MLKKLLPFLLCFLPSVAQARMSSGQHEAILDEMALFVEPCVQPTTGPGVFVHCYDLHSSIHAHWAAYRLARAKPDLGYLALTSETALEYDKVRYHHPEIDYIYAKAWFLLLALEYERWAVENERPDPLRLAPIANDLAEALLLQYQLVPPNPQWPEYGNPSWAVLQLYRWYEHRGNESGRGAVQVLIRDHFYEPVTAHRFGWDQTNNSGFFSTYSNWIHLIVETQTTEVARAWVALQYDPPDAHLEVNAVSTIHNYGLGWSRVWGLRSLARVALSPVDRGRFWRAAEHHVQVGMSRHLQFAGSFATYDHWVPQFAIYAVTEGMGL